MFIQEGNQMPAAEGFYVPFIGAGSAATVGGGWCGGGMAFDIDGDKVVRCGLMFGRRWLTCADTTIEALSGGSASGVIFASVSHASGASPTLTVRHQAGNDVPDSTLDVSNRLLYKAEGTGSDTSWADYRSAITIFAMD